MRTFVIGDIHSGLKALIEVLSHIKPLKEDQFIFLGDYVDGWSEAAQTVSLLLKFSQKHNCIFIRGNHDYLMYCYLKHNDTNPMWLAHGGQASKDSYDALSSEEKAIHLEFFEKVLVNYHIDPKNRLFVHAGFTNLNGIEYEHHKSLVFWDRTLWEMVTCLDVNISEENKYYPKRLKHYKEIYIGHTPVTRMGTTTPLNFANVWNIDTGAAFKGPLTILDVDSKEYWQSTPVHSLYPGELGRN